MDVYTYAYLLVCIYANVRIYIFTCMHICIYLHIDMFTYRHVYIDTNMHKQVWNLDKYKHVFACVRFPSTW